MQSVKARGTPHSGIALIESLFGPRFARKLVRYSQLTPQEKRAKADRVRLKRRQALLGGSSGVSSRLPAAEMANTVNPMSTSNTGTGAIVRQEKYIGELLARLTDKDAQLIQAKTDLEAAEQRASDRGFWYEIVEHIAPPLVSQISESNIISFSDLIERKDLDKYKRTFRMPGGKPKKPR